MDYHWCWKKIGPYMCGCMCAGHRNGHLTCICDGVCFNRERMKWLERMRQWAFEWNSKSAIQKRDIAWAPKMRQKSNRMCEKWEKIMTHFSFSISLLFAPLLSPPWSFFLHYVKLSIHFTSAVSLISPLFSSGEKVLADKNVCFRFVFVSYFMPFSYRTAQVWHFTRNHCFLLSLSIRYLHK